MGSGPPDPAAVRHDNKQLLAADLLLAQASVLAVADLCRHAVDGLVARQCALLRQPGWPRCSPVRRPPALTRAPATMASSSSSLSGSFVIVTVLMGRPLIRDTECPEIYVSRGVGRA